MTLRQPNIERMLQLGISGMAAALEEQRDIADIEQLGFDDRLAMMLEREPQHPGETEHLEAFHGRRVRSCAPRGLRSAPPAVASAGCRSRRRCLTAG